MVTGFTTAQWITPPASRYCSMSQHRSSTSRKAIGNGGGHWLDYVLLFHFLSEMQLRRLLGGRRLSWIRGRAVGSLRRSEFPRANDRGVGGVTPPLGLLAARHAAQAHGEAGVTTGGGSNSIGVDFAVSTACPLWVKSGHLQRKKRCPLYPQ